MDYSVLPNLRTQPEDSQQTYSKMIYGARIFAFLAICIFLPQICNCEMDTFYEDPQVAIGRFMEMNKQWNLFTTKNGHMLANKAMHRKPKSGYNSDLAKLNLTAQCYNDTRKLHKDLEALHEYAIQSKYLHLAIVKRQRNRYMLYNICSS